MSILSHFWALLDLNGVLLGPLEVLLWPLKWLKHIILTQHTQAHCVEVFWMPTSLSGTVWEDQRGPKRDQILHFGYLDPQNSLCEGGHQKIKVTLGIKTALHHLVWGHIFFRLALSKFAMCHDMGPPTANRGAYGAKNWPLFPSPMTLQLCN